MAIQLQDRMRDWERQLFVGREPEVSAFRALLDSDSPVRILKVYGPGGIGKTMLLSEFQAICQELGIKSIYIDCRHVEPSPSLFSSALATQLPADDVEIFEYLAMVEEQIVLFFDTWETLRPLDYWVREEFIPQLSDQVIVVTAGRDPPMLEWRTKPGFHLLVQLMPLRNLSRSESRVFLSRRQVPEQQVEPVLKFTHGHPLALALVGDVCAQRTDSTFLPEYAMDAVKVLLEQLIQDIPDPSHRAALEAAAIVRSLTEALLSDLMQDNEAGKLFDWLCGLSCMEFDPDGIRPHDLVREALITDLRWRNPDRYAVLHERAREAYYRQFYDSSGIAQQRVLLDLIYLHRDNPVVQPFFDWQTTGSSTPDLLRPEDLPDLLEMVQRHEGRCSASLAAHWIERQPENVVVFRGEDRRPEGFIISLALEQLDPAHLEVDPAVDTAVRYLENHISLRPGEVVTFFRFWMGRETYQDVSPIQSLVFLHVARHYLLTPGLAYSLFPCADPDFWAPFFEYGDLDRVEPAAFTIAGRDFGVYGHDWRVRPPLAWLALLADREMNADITAPTATSPTVIVLSRPDFADAVRDALRNLKRPDRLQENPLLRSRLVVDRSGPDADFGTRVAGLESAFQEIAQQLTTTPRMARGYRPLYHTYFVPAPTQEKAAELLDLPFSTYRRHLRDGIDSLTNLLWQHEIGDVYLQSGS